MAELDAFKLQIVDDAPSCEHLPGADGKSWGLDDFHRSPLLLVVFSCNHCPYAQAWEGRIIELVREFATKGLATIMINSNETVNYPDDRMDRMVERARSKGYPFPYVRDDDQSVAKAYGALVTPHPFLFDRERRLIFQGKPDDSWQVPSKVKRAFLREAIESAVAKKPIPTPLSSVIGCTIKWK